MPYPWGALDVLEFDELNDAFGAWTTWTPTLSNLTQGSGTVLAKYRLSADVHVDFYFRFVLAADSAVGTEPGFTLPVACHSDFSTATLAFPAAGTLRDAAPAYRQAAILISGTTIAQIRHWNSTPTVAQTTATVPWTWTTNDSLTVWGSYYA